MVVTPSKSIKSKVCIICADRFETPHANTTCCSDECKRKRKNQLQMEKKATYKPKSNYVKKEETKRVCAACGEDFFTAHYSKRTCGKVCTRKLQDMTAREIQLKAKGNGVRGEEVKIGKLPQKFLERGKIKYRGLTI